jgi:hypothetical protein
MTLIEWRPIENAGALIGRARVLLPIGLEISDVGVFSKDGRRWAQLPAQPMRDSDGKPITGPDGKARYVSLLKWATRELQNGFSTAVLALIDDERGFGSRESPAAIPAPPRHAPAAPYRLERSRPGSESLPSDPLDDLWRDDEGGAP